MRTSAPPRWAAALLAVLLLAPATAALAQGRGGGAVAPADAGGAPPAPLAGGTALGPTSPPAPTGPNTLQPPAGGAILGTPALVHGQLTPAQAGRLVTLETQDQHGAWTTAGSSRADGAGNFVVSWRPKHLGRFLLRASAAGRTPVAPAPVEVYRSVIATYFGPGFFGSRTACGQILTPQLIGVAHRTLPCGTMVDIVHGSQTITVPVVDRGPYAPGVAYDLTSATAQALGVSETVRIGAVALRDGVFVAP